MKLWDNMYFGFGGAPIQFTRKEKYSYDTPLTRIVSVFLVIIFFVYSWFVFKWWNKKESYLEIIDRTLLFTSNTNLYEEGKKFLNFTNLQIPRGSVATVQTCIETDGLVYRTYPGDSLSIWNLECRSTRGACTSEFNISESTISVNTSLACGSFERYAEAKIVGSLKYFSIIADNSSSLRRVYKWTTGKLTDTVKGYEIVDYVRKMAAVDGGYHKSYHFYAQRVKIRTYDTILGRSYTENTIFIVTMEAEELYTGLNYGRVSLRLFLRDEKLIREIRPATLLWTLAQIGGIASIFSGAIILLRLYNHLKLQKRQEPIAIEDLRKLLDKESPSHQQRQSLDLEYDEMDFSLAGGFLRCSAEKV